VGTGAHDFTADGEISHETDDEVADIALADAIDLGSNAVQGLRRRAGDELRYSRPRTNRGLITGTGGLESRDRRHLVPRRCQRLQRRRHHR